MSAAHIIRYQCDYCEAKHEVVFEGMLLPFSQLITCQVPYGWSWVGNKIVCPIHCVTIDADGPPLGIDGNAVDSPMPMRSVEYKPDSELKPDGRD